MLSKVAIVSTIITLLLLTSCKGITIDTDKIKAEYDAGYTTGYAKGFIDGVASCNKTIFEEK